MRLVTTILQHKFQLPTFIGTYKILVWYTLTLVCTIAPFFKRIPKLILAFELDFGERVDNVFFQVPLP
jgi:hypothetical protein